MKTSIWSRRILRELSWCLVAFRSATLAVLFLGLTTLATTVGAGDEATNAQTEAKATTALKDIEAPETETSIPTAPVRIDGVTLFRVRGTSSFPAEKRAESIAERILAVAGDASITTDQLRIQESDDRSQLLAGARPLMGVFDADARLEGVRRNLIAQVNLARIGEAIKAYREARSAPVLLRHGLYTLVATGVLLLFLFLLRKGFRRLDALVEQRFGARIQALKIQSMEIVQAEKLWLMVRGALRTTWGLTLVVAAYLYLHYCLSLFPWTSPLAHQLLDLLMQPLATLGRGILEAVPGLLFIAVLVVVIRYALKLTRLFFEAAHSGRVQLSGFDAEWSWPTYRIIRLLVIAFGVVVAYPYIPGSDSAAFKGVSIFLGIVFSLGSSTALANVVAGYTMTYRRAFKIGDRIKVGDHIGDVVEMRLLVTHLRTPKNEEVVIPNSEILNNPIVNYTSIARERGLILHTTVGIGYETPWRQVEAMLLEAAARTPELLPEPKPFVFQQSLGDFCVVYEINVYCDKPGEMGRLYTLLHQNILDLFNEYGVQIMTPAYEGDPEVPKLVPKEQWFTAPARPAA